ncbi:hypothetical protein C8Q77DRAFT_731456 [Trametes polyzona]|nr:hypothetical protein C8Q77DRAFT_731456 [Trametes polyzona]
MLVANDPPSTRDPTTGKIKTKTNVVLLDTYTASGVGLQHAAGGGVLIAGGARQCRRRDLRKQRGNVTGHEKAGADGRHEQGGPWVGGTAPRDVHTVIAEGMREPVRDADGTIVGGRSLDVVLISVEFHINGRRSCA